MKTKQEQERLVKELIARITRVSHERATGMHRRAKSPTDYGGDWSIGLQLKRPGTTGLEPDKDWTRYGTYAGFAEGHWWVLIFTEPFTWGRIQGYHHLEALQQDWELD
jgi:hypothetical protein